MASAVAVPGTRVTSAGEIPGIPGCNSSTGLPGRFMDGHHVIEVIVSEAPVVTVVCKGRKENVLFVVDNTINAGNQTSNKYSNFADGIMGFDKEFNKEARLHYDERWHGAVR